MSSCSLPKTPFYNQFSARLKDACHKSATLRSLRKAPVHASLHSHPPTLSKKSVRGRMASRKGDRFFVPYGFKSSGNAEDDCSALDAVLKLYSAIEQRNLRELSKVIGDECRCVCNFIPYFHPFYGKKEVLEFFAYIMKYMGQHMEFVVQPTMHDGMMVTVRWKLEWGNTHMPLGKGFSFYVCHTYQGKVVIKNVEMFMEPVFHLEPLRLKMMGLVTLVLERISSCAINMDAGKRTTLISLGGVVTIVILLILLKIFRILA